MSFCDVEWLPTPIQSAQPLPTGLLTGLNQITAAIAREVGRVSHIQGAFVPGDYRMGMAGMTHQFCIDMEIDEQRWRDGVPHEEYIVPVGERFAQDIRDREICRFGALPLPRPGVVEEAVVATDTQTGMTVRGIRAFNDVPSHWMTWFDIIGGSTV